MLRVTEINDINQFLEMRSTWNGVLDRCSDKNIFLTWEYLSTYWKHFGKKTKLRILRVEDKRGIIAIAPLRQSRLGLAGPLAYEVIEPLGYRGQTPEGADYTGLMLADRKTECLRSLLDYLNKDDSWDFIYLMDMPASSVMPNLFSKMSNLIPFRFETEEGRICPYILFPDSFDTFMKTLSPKLRKNMRRNMKQLQSDFGKIELKRYDELGSVEEAMECFFELHQKRCENKGLPGVFAKQEIRDFYVDVARLFADNEWLALYFLAVNNEPVAANYCFEYNNKMLVALTGFDPHYSRYSIGNLMTLITIEKSIKKGLEEYDFLKGDEAYKFSWTTKFRRNSGIKFVNNKFTSNLCYLAVQAMNKSKIRGFFDGFLAYR